MRDPRVESLAEVLVRYSVDVQPGQLVVIEGTSVAADLVRSLYRSVLAVGGHPEPRVGIDGIRETLLARGSDEQLDWLSPRLLDDVERADARIQILAESNTRSLS